MGTKRLGGMAAIGFLALTVTSPAADVWTEFRGPSGTGHSDSVGLPREWSETRHVAWKAEVHGRAWSSPFVIGKRVWLTTATPDGRELSVLALDRDTGRVLLDRKVFQVDKPEDTGPSSSAPIRTSTGSNVGPDAGDRSDHSLSGAAAQ